MRKHLCVIILAFGFFILQIQVNGQCTPGNYSEPGIYPDTTTNLPKGAAGQVYDEVVTIVVPEDTTINMGGGQQTIQIDSIGITGIQGLPSGFDYQPNSNNGYWPGDSSGCILITGNPTMADTGTYPLIIDSKVSGGGFTVPLIVEGYEIVILDSTHANIWDNKAVNNISAYPNPFDEYLTINFEMNMNAPVKLSIFNMVGNEVRAKNIKATKGSNRVSLNTSKLPEGVYFYRFNTGDKVITRKLVKK